MLLTIDIGNTTTKFAVFKNEELIKKFIIPTNRSESAESIFTKVSKHFPQPISAIVISTVVKELRETYTNFGSKFFGQEPFFVDHTFNFGFEIKYFPPENCGVDRLVAAFAAVKKTEVSIPLIVCDFGTATNIEVVNSKNQYLGGIITPGPNTLGSALFEKTSKLPNVEFLRPEHVIGNTTVSSIQSGIYYGYIGLIDGIIERIFDELGERSIDIISTGGYAEIIAQDSKYINDELIYKNLILDGLRFVNEKLLQTVIGQP